MTLVQGHILTSVSSLKIQQTISDLMRRQTSRVKGQHHVEYLILLSFVSLWMLVQLLVVDMCVCTLDCLLCTMDVYIVYSQRVAGDTFTLVYRNSNGFRKRPQFNKYIVSLPLCNAFCRKTQLHELKIWVTGKLSGKMLAQGLRSLRFKSLPLHPVVEMSSPLTSSSCCSYSIMLLSPVKQEVECTAETNKQNQHL